MRWRRRGLRLCCCWKSRSRKPGRPRINEEIRKRIQRMSQEKLTWGAPRIESELRLLGFDVAERTVEKYMVRIRKSPTQTWRTFLNNHVLEVTDINILEVGCSTLRQLYRFTILRHVGRRLRDILSETTSAASRSSPGAIPISVFGDSCSATECNVRPCYRSRRTESHPVKPSAPAG